MSSPGREEGRLMTFLVEIGVFLILCSGLSGSIGVRKQSRWHKHQRWSPRGHILKSLALASRLQVLENWPVLGSRTALFFELLKFCGALENFSGKRFLWRLPEKFL